jgi:hypothetical protein
MYNPRRLDNAFEEMTNAKHILPQYRGAHANSVRRRQ